MMNIKKIFEETLKLDNELNRMKEEYDKAILTIKRNYANDLLKSKLESERMKYENSRDEKKAEYEAMVKKGIEEIKAKITENTCSDIPLDLSAAVSVIDTMGKNLSEEDAVSFCEKYKNDYFALKTVVLHCQKYEKLKYVHVISKEEVLRSADQAETDALNWCRNHGVNSLSDALILNEKTTPFARYERVVDSFIEKEYMYK